MKFQRLLILAFAAALTAGTSSANSVLFQMYVGSGSQTLSLSVDGQLFGPYTEAWNGGLALSGEVNEPTDRWYSISIDYQSSAFRPGLTLYIGSALASMDQLASYDGSGNTVHGLTGTYYWPLGSNTPVETSYQENPINYSATSTPWSNWSNTWNPFEEKLNGYVWIGTTNPDYNLVPAGTQSTTVTDPPPPDSGADAPEPGTWLLMAIALPLMVFSRLRLRPARIRK